MTDHKNSTDSIITAEYTQMDFLSRVQTAINSSLNRMGLAEPPAERHSIVIGQPAREPIPHGQVPS